MYSRKGAMRAWRGNVPLSPFEKESKELEFRSRTMSPIKRPETLEEVYVSPKFSHT